MARIKYAPDITKIANEHQGFTFQNTRSANVMMKGQANDRHRSTRQQNRQVNLINPSSHWRTLTPAQRSAWELFAATYPQPTKKAGTIFLTGYQLFKKRCQYCHLNYDIANGFIFSPVMEELPAFTFTPTIEQTVNVIDVTEPYIKQFGVIPAAGQWILFKAVPMAVKSGQFYPVIYDQLQVIESYIDGLFISLEIPPGTPEVVISVFLSKPFNQSVRYSGTKTRYMGCFTSKKFIELTDVPEIGVPDDGKVWGVKPDGTWGLITPAGGGGLTCETLADCPTIVAIQNTLELLAINAVIDSFISIPSVNYGIMYNTKAVFNAKGFFATGWEIDNYTKELSLVTYLSPNPAYKIKEVGTTFWGTDNFLSTNIKKLNYRGGGYRNGYDGQFGAPLKYTSRNMLGPLDVSYCRNLILMSQSDSMNLGNQSAGVKFGYYVRAIKSTTTLTEGQQGIYKGNNGRLYRTICINGTEIMADNICETLYRDGSQIEECTDNAQWALNARAYLCAPYNNWEDV